jgi:hypothetical protein
VASPDSMPPIPSSSSALKSPDPQSTGSTAEGEGDNPNGNTHLISCVACMYEQCQNITCKNLGHYRIPSDNLEYFDNPSSVGFCGCRVKGILLYICMCIIVER